MNAGADKVSINTAAVKDPAFIKQASEKFGSQCIVLAIDAKKNSKMKNKYEVYIYGGRQPTGLDVIEWAKKGCMMGAGEILLTSMDRDGTKKGFDLELTRKVSELVPVPVIASGGVGTTKHFVEAFTQGKADAALAASVFHYSTFTVDQVKDACKKSGIVMRA